MFCLVAFAVPGAMAQEGCPAELARDVAPEAPECRLVGEGRLVAGLGNGDVDYRLYRWVSTREEPPGPIYDSPPYHSTAVTLSLADRPDTPPFWSAHYWLGMAWFETPHLVRNPDYGEFLIVPGRYTGTGSFIEDRVFMPSHGRGWTEIRAAALDLETGAGWVAELQSRLPPGHGIWKGVRLDYATLTGTSSVWRDSDANCCPSGGEVRFRLRVAGPEPRLEVAEAQLMPPPE